MVTDTEWKAIIENNPSYDDQFRYAVKTTKIFCRPSCPSRPPKRENITGYYDFTEPEKDGFRPCKRCQPNGKPVDDTLWVEEIDTILQEQYAENLTLKELAYLAHGSESHLRHVFKKVTQKTPSQRLLDIRLTAAKKALLPSDKTIS